ncbi:hypothetical protein [Microbacterium tenebrionis]|uniref:hypothetical protein n=1 Tax=Microbacterium tenebrionis TaxID=2830665 RepID=UPI00158DF41A|nr:hypothetical protein [Microbacterium ihumii]
MSPRAARPRNALHLPRFLAVLVASIAVVIGTVTPIEAATATAASSTSGSTASLARSMTDLTQTGLVKTSLAGFNAGNIISDAVFTNSGTMTEASIQSFLNSKVSKCVVGKDEDGLPFVCLKDLRTATQSKAADAYCKAYSGASSESAARILYKVAQACGINPQVLIVMLQKEQGLVTHIWPSNWRYNKAMGQACPDTAPCDTAFAGFFTQVYGAARQMQIYMEGRYFQWYKAGKTWQVQYHPNKACGTAPVYIANKATEALYYYTPYQPNAAALRADYGAGDGCSSYGNRNFYNYFTDWFGSTQATVAPRTALDEMTAIPGGVRVRGWAFVPGAADITVKIHVTAGGIWKQTVLADQSRPDVATVYGLSDKTTGYSADVTLPSGSTRVCLRAENPRDGSQREIGCKWLNIPDAGVVGSLDAIRLAPGGTFVAGWATDGDSTSPVKIQVLVDDKWSRTLLANKPRADLGASRGFESVISLQPGTRKVCLVAENVGRGSSLSFPCTWLNIPSGDVLGSVASWNAVPQGIQVSGWLLDPDTTAPVRVQVLVNNKWSRTIVADAYSEAGMAQYPQYGTAHGLQQRIPLSAGWNKVCLIADNVGGGAPRDLGCRTTTVYAGDAFGSVDAVTAVAGGASVKGWVIDPDTSDPVKVQVLVDNKWSRTVLASAAYSGLAKRYPAYGDAHGIDVVIPLQSGTRKICLVADAVGSGSALDLGCKWVVVKGNDPIGALESVDASANTVRLTGWAYDSDTNSALKVQLLVDNVWHSTVIAAGPRGDLAVTQPRATSSGFDRIISLAPGQHKICAIAENVGSGSNTQLGCVWRTAG